MTVNPAMHWPMKMHTDVRFNLLVALYSYCLQLNAIYLNNTNYSCTVTMIQPFSTLILWHFMSLASYLWKTLYHKYYHKYELASIFSSKNQSKPSDFLVSKQQAQVFDFNKLWQIVRLNKTDFVVNWLRLIQTFTAQFDISI